MTAKRKRRTKRCAEARPEPVPADPAPPERAAATEAPQEGMRCRGCGCRHMPALFTRHHGNRTYRTRRCRSCGRLVRTQERVVSE
ncbi:MAG: hypothetical protein EXS05_03850 [Planctomycetaceae bacterium]|nr:hypothetical protein [Planctomycetaceae bacterium]